MPLPLLAPPSPLPDSTALVIGLEFPRRPGEERRRRAEEGSVLVRNLDQQFVSTRVVSGSCVTVSPPEPLIPSTCWALNSWFSPVSVLGFSFCSKILFGSEIYELNPLLGHLGRYTIVINRMRTTGRNFSCPASSESFLPSMMLWRLVSFQREKKRASAGSQAFKRRSAVLLLSVIMIAACMKVILVVQAADGVAIYDRNRFWRDSISRHNRRKACLRISTNLSSVEVPAASVLGHTNAYCAWQVSIDSVGTSHYFYGKGSHSLGNLFGSIGSSELGTNPRKRRVDGPGAMEARLLTAGKKRWQ